MTFKFPNTFLKYLFITSFSLSIFLILFVNTEGSWKHLLLHSSMEAAGATIAIVLAIILLMIDTFHLKKKYILFGYAFLTMGLLDGVHALLASGNSFVFFHSVASLVGGIFFIFVWFESTKKIVFASQIILVTSALALVSLLSMLLFNEYTHYMPIMIDAEQNFTDIAFLINTIAGVLFLLSALKLFLDYIKFNKVDDFIFFSVALFFAIAEVLLYTSSLWQYEWWLSHFIRFFSYLIVLYFIALEIRKQKNTLDYEIYYDTLTGLPNRLLFTDRLTQTIEESNINKNKFALFYLDLDHFKNINDSHGYIIGDEVLKTVTQKLNEIVKSGDTVSRLGGDEFTIIMENISGSDEACILAEKIIKNFSKPLQIQNKTLDISTSIGISIYPFDGVDSIKLLKNADMAMYQSKVNGRNDFKLYTTKMTQHVLEKINMEASIRASIRNEDFIVYYQPQMNAENDTLIGMEALVRWNHPIFGLIAPYKFIPLAEETGLIIELDQLVMKIAMTQFSQWYKQGLNPGILSLNLSVKQLEEEDFIATLKNLIKTTNCKTKWIELEITEGGIMLNPEKSILILDKLNYMDIKLSVDDFGTGYSSLSYLKKLPIYKLKIDREFIKDISTNEDDKAIVKAIISLAENLNLKVIAEGVETLEQKEFLLEHKCKNIQGFLYSKPIPTAEIEKMLLKKI